MSRPQVSSNDLYAFVDKQLDSEKQARVLAALQHDGQMADRINRLRHIKTLIAFAHQEPPLPPWTPSLSASRDNATGLWPAAAAIVVLLSVVINWGNQTPAPPVSSPVFEDISHFDPSQADAERILLHVSSMDPERIGKTLNAVETLLADSKKHGRNTQVEIVAAAEGLKLLRQGSPYKTRIHSIVSEHDNVEFLACGIAMQNAAMKEGKNVELLPEADKVDAALEEILRKLRQGWHYVRG